MQSSTVLIAYLGLINLVAFVVFGVDKRRAKCHRWRVREATLLGLAFLGGALGALLGMVLFRHKTKKVRFTVGVPLMLGMQVLALLYFASRFLP